MLETKKSITFNGYSRFNGVLAAEYQAIINSEDPEGMTLSVWIRNPALYKENRTTCRAESDEFETMVYAYQDEMIADKAVATATE